MWKASTSSGSTGMPKLLWEKRPALIDPDTPFDMLQIQVDDVVLHPAAAYHNSSFVQTTYGCVGALTSFSWIASTPPSGSASSPAIGSGGPISFPR